MFAFLVEIIVALAGLLLCWIMMQVQVQVQVLVGCLVEAAAELANSEWQVFCTWHLVLF